MKRFFSFLLMLGIVVSVAVAVPTEVHAAGDSSCNRTFLIGLRPWYYGLTKKVNGKCEIDESKMGSDENGDGLAKFVWAAVLNVVIDLVSVIGWIAAGMIVWGGIQYMLATGDPGKVAAAKNMIISAVIGLLIVVLANVIMNTIVNVLIS